MPKFPWFAFFGGLVLIGLSIGLVYIYQEPEFVPFGSESPVTQVKSDGDY